MGMARYGAASEVGFAKAEYDEYGNRKMSGNQKLGVAGAATTAAGLYQFNRGYKWPYRSAQNLQNSYKRIAAAQADVNNRTGVPGRTAAKKLATAQAVLAGEKRNNAIHRANFANKVSRQKTLYRAGKIGSLTGLGISGVAAARGVNNLKQGG